MRRIAAVAPTPPLLEYMGPRCEAFALSTYSRCDFRCVYCVTGVQGVSTPRVGKEAVAKQLRAELAEICGTRIAVGALCDAYPHAEREFEVTRAALEALVQDEREFGIITKGTTVLRDIDLLLAANRPSVTISLCSIDDDVLHRIDPKAPRAGERLAVVRQLMEHGIEVLLSAAPWIPGITDAESLIDAVDGDVPIWFTALNVHDPAVAASPFARRFDQAQVYAAFEQERDRIGPRHNVFWRQPDELGIGAHTTTAPGAN